MAPARISAASARSAGSLFLLLMMLSLLLPPAPARAVEPAELQTFSSRHYTIHTNMPPQELQTLARHMDSVFDVYQRRFKDSGMRARDTEPMPLYLLRTREQYVDFLSRIPVNGANTGGVFFVQPQVSMQGLATFVEGRSPSETYAVLQHEGFHQFAWQYIGQDLPIWINEGIAQYFEEGILVKSGLVLNLVNADRLAVVQQAVSQDKHLPFEKMLSMTPETWAATLNRSAEEGALLYEQAWSMVLFLINGDGGKYRKAFESYLQLVAQNIPSQMAFKRAFGTEDTRPFEQAWRTFVMKLEADAVSIAASRMSFLAQALRYLHENDKDMPRDIEELKQMLQRMQFRAIRQTNQVRTEITAMDDDNYRYEVGRGTAMFQLLTEKRGMPPRITAPRMKPTPTLVWSRDAEGKFLDDIVWE